jgi:hypothetical protein
MRAGLHFFVLLLPYLCTRNARRNAVAYIPSSSYHTWLTTVSPHVLFATVQPPLQPQNTVSTDVPFGQLSPSRPLIRNVI